MVTIFEIIKVCLYCELSKSLDSMDARTGRSAMTAVVITAFELSEIC